MGYFECFLLQFQKTDFRKQDKDEEIYFYLVNIFPYKKRIFVTASF